MSPNHPQLWAFLSYGALVLLFKREFGKALDWAERASDVPNCQYWALAHAAVALSFLDRPNEARQMVERLLAEQPTFTRTFAEKKLFYLERPEQLALYLKGLDKAGVPAMQIGISGGEGLSLLGGAGETALAALAELNEGWLPEFMDGA